MQKELSLEVRGNRVVVELEDVGEKTTGGIYVPQTVQQEGPKVATVVAVGDSYLSGGVTVRGSVRPGDRVMVDTLGAVPVVIDQRKLLIVRNDDVVGVYRA